MQNNAPTIILVRPQMGDNIGMVARAMGNMNFHDLRIISPRDGWPNERAYVTASKANWILDNAKIYNDLSDAIQDLHLLIATTNRNRHMNKEYINSEEASDKIVALSQNNLKTGILFGEEANGLHNNDITLCNYILSIEVNPDFTSLNLAQAVLLTCFSIKKKFDNLLKTDIADNLKNQDIKQDKISINEFEFFSQKLFKLLENTNFLSQKNINNTTLTNDIKQIFLKAELTTRELKILHGMISNINKNLPSK